MKKVIIIILVLVLFVVYQLVKPLRTDSVMKSIAEDEMYNFLILDERWDNDSIEKLKGPLVLSVRNGSSVGKNYTWYKVLDWNDTAKISITVYKNLSSSSFSDKFFHPKIDLNKYYNYFSAKRERDKFKNYIRKRFRNSNVNFDKIYFKSSTIDTTYEYQNDKQKLAFYINNGYFGIHEKENIIFFYESFAHIRSKINVHYTTDARIELNSNSEIVIIPIPPK